MQKYYSYIILGAVALGLLFPQTGNRFQPALLYILMAAMFFSCLKIDWKQLKSIRDIWWQYLAALLLIFFVPAIIVALFSGWLGSSFYVGAAVIAAVPCAVSVVFLADSVGGHTLPALITTSLAHLIAPLVTPFIIWLLAHKYVTVEFLPMIFLIAKVIIIPIVLAQIFRYLKWDQPIISRVGAVNVLLLVLMVWGTIAPARDLIFQNLLIFIKVALVMLISLAVAAGLSILIGKDRKYDVTWAVVSGYKNLILASVLALTLFGPAALLAPAAYNILSNILLIPLQWWGKKRAR